MWLMKTLLTSRCVNQRGAGQSADDGYNVNYYKVSMLHDACKNQYGTVGFYTLDGKLSFNADYIDDGGSMGAFIGGVICELQIKDVQSGK